MTQMAQKVETTAQEVTTMVNGTSVAPMILGNLYVSIDVGTTKVCTLIAQVSPAGELEIVGTGVEKSYGMSKGLVVDLDSMEMAIRNSMYKAKESLDVDIPGACIGVTGSHILSVRTTGTLNDVNGSRDRAITRQVMQKAVKLSYPKVTANQELLHVVPQSYTVDAVHGIRNPAGLRGHQLTVESHAIIGEAASLDNVVHAVERAGIEVKAMVLEPLASAEAVLSADEREMGVVLVDIGGGTSDVAVFKNDVIAHTSVIPVGGFQFTNDIVVSLGVPYEAAEEAKLKYGDALFDNHEYKETIEILGYEGEQPRVIRRREFCRLLHDRASELVRLVLYKMKEAGFDTMPPGGIVFTGGGSNLRGLEELAREYIPGPIRLAPPRDILGLPEELKSPTYSTSVGILLWGIHHPAEQQDYSNEGDNGATKTFSRGRGWLRRLAQLFKPNR